MTEQLKPCLHCLGENIEVHAIGKISPVKCMTCGMVAPNVDTWNSRPSPWVPVSERLPEDDRLVIVAEGLDPSKASKYADLGLCAEDVSGGYFIDGKWWFDHPDADNPMQMTRVTHWMPLPPAPETKGE